ncbi:uncharacterized protein LOC123716587 [Pieris brassicae]|uniref:uncharacterized protein LOC123716587 n=1 Tax=Pieris brassicae TaxID=7116 RepID=UPI001E65F7BB|nr:uncharacterized protein LOC123716587 [Pieris brassicae]
MFSLVVGLLAIQFIPQISYSLKFNADLDRILKILQKQKNVEAINHSDEDFHTHNDHSDNKYHKYVFNDDRGNSISTDTSEIKHPALNKIDKLLHKKQSIPHEIDSKNLQDYSKVYLVLDPQAKISTADVKRIGEMVSSLISSQGMLETKPPPKKAARYKGFVLMDDFLGRRRNRDSIEKFSKDSIERDYKPKRARNDYAGGGRTAIPYIGHRGDIYEKE